MPDMPDIFVDLVSERYIELFENITGRAFVKGDISTIESRVEANVLGWMKE
jgi:phosphoribosylaminoimidazole-succinocarboxamide synthase